MARQWRGVAVGEGWGAVRNGVSGATPRAAPHPLTLSPAGISWLDRYASGAWRGVAWPARCLARRIVGGPGLIVAADSLPLLVLIVGACRLGRYCSSSSRVSDAPRRL